MFKVLTQTGDVSHSMPIQLTDSNLLTVLGRETEHVC